MANVDAPFGLRPIATINGGNYKDSIIQVVALDSYAVDLFVGSPVKVVGSSDASGKFQAVELAAAGENIDYIITGFLPDFENESLNTLYGPASTERQILAVPAPYTIFEIQASDTIAVTDVNSVADITAETGSTISGGSTVELDAATIATGSSAQLMILGVTQARENDDISSANANLRVRINESNLAFGSNGV